MNRPAFVFAFIVGMLAAAGTTNAPRAFNQEAAASRAFLYADYGTADGGSVVVSTRGCYQGVLTGAYTPRRNQADFIVDTSVTTADWVETTPAVVTASKTTTVMNVTAVTSGTLQVGMYLSGTGWPVCNGTTAPCYIKSLGTGTGNTGTYNMEGDCSGTIASTTVTGRQEGRLTYDGGTARTFAVQWTESFDCHNGLIMVYRWVGKNGTVITGSGIETYIVNANPVNSHSFGTLVTMNPGDYLEGFYSINAAGEHYEMYRANMMITQAD